MDNLFYIILAFTGVSFVLTEALLVWFMWRYAYKPGRKVAYVHGNHRLELSGPSPRPPSCSSSPSPRSASGSGSSTQGLMPQPDQIVQVTARQWEWRSAIPADVTKTDAEGRAWAEIAGDRRPPHSKRIAHLEGRQRPHLPQDAGRDPQLRPAEPAADAGRPARQDHPDVVLRPPTSNTQWDEATGRCEEPDDASRRWEIACKELCGGGHYRMRGRLYVHQSQDDYERWLNSRRRSQNSHEPETARPSRGRRQRRTVRKASRGRQRPEVTRPRPLTPRLARKLTLPPLAGVTSYEDRA